MTAAGAVNPGWTYFWLATPFMFLLLYLVYGYGKILFASSVLLCVLAITVSLNADRLQLLYPIISGGEVIILKDGHLILSPSGSKLYSDEEFAKISAREAQRAVHVQRGQSFKVLQMERRYIEFNTEINLVTDIGKFNDYNYASFAFKDQKIQVPQGYHAIDPRIFTTNKDLIAPWVTKLSGLLWLNWYIPLLVGSVVLTIYSKRHPVTPKIT
jgi:hypothetical protein